MAGLGPRSPAWSAFCQRAIVAPGRGRWLSLPVLADVEAVARAVFCTLGQRAPAGLARQLSGLGLPAVDLAADDLRPAPLALGVPEVLQDRRVRYSSHTGASGWVCACVRTGHRRWLDCFAGSVGCGVLGNTVSLLGCVFRSTGGLVRDKVDGAV